jgi:hypothetical protein
MFSVSLKSDHTLGEIADNQAALRRSIETTKKLVDQSDYLIQRHRQELEHGD